MKVSPSVKSIFSTLGSRLVGPWCWLASWKPPPYYITEQFLFFLPVPKLASDHRLLTKFPFQGSTLPTRQPLPWLRIQVDLYQPVWTSSHQTLSSRGMFSLHLTLQAYNLGLLYTYSDSNRQQKKENGAFAAVLLWEWQPLVKALSEPLVFLREKAAMS